MTLVSNFMLYISQFLAACLTNGFWSSKKSSIRNKPALFSSINYLFDYNKSLYLKPVNLQKWENLWIEAYLSGALCVLNDLFTVYVN